MKIAVIGATGLVGREMISQLEKRNISISELLPAASKRSEGKSIHFRGNEVRVLGMSEAVERKPDIAIFSAGASASLEWAPRFAEKGTFVIDNSSAWRMDPLIPLVVPEVNPHDLSPEKKIIANPNCSTIQMVVALHPLHKAFTIKRVVVATYQSVTGSGAKGKFQLEGERKGEEVARAYPHPIDLNVIPEAGTFENDEYTSEELKLERETQKILGDSTIRVTATAVRVAVMGGHSEAVNVEFEKPFEITTVRKLLESQPGITILDDPHNHIYPTPLQSEGKDDVFVGRVRRDYSIPNGLNFWVVSDNLRKGAATNAVQIAEYLIDQNFIKR